MYGCLSFSVEIKQIETVTFRIKFVQRIHVYCKRQRLGIGKNEFHWRKIQI